MDNIEIELKLTVAHVNAILAHLAKGAYAEVSDLIAHIRAQALPQVSAAQASTQVAEASLDAQEKKAPAAQ